MNWLGYRGIFPDTLIFLLWGIFLIPCAQNWAHMSQLLKNIHLGVQAPTKDSIAQRHQRMPKGTKVNRINNPKAYPRISKHTKPSQVKVQKPIQGQSRAFMPGLVHIRLTQNLHEPYICQGCFMHRFTAMAF